MTELKQQIKQARELVDLAEKRESVGGKLEPLVQDLFLHSSEIGGENLESFRGLCFKIAEMRKGTSLGCKFYKLLEESQLPFALDVLRFGVDAESYYNCNDAALKSYVLASLRKSQIPQEVIMPLDLGLPEGHIMSSYTKYLRSLGDSKPQPSPEISAELKQTLLFAASRRRFEQTRYKSFCAITYLDVQEAIPLLRVSFQRSAQEMDKELQREYGEYGFLVDLAATATTLGYLTDNREFRDLVDFVTPEIQLRRKIPLPEKFVLGLQKKMAKF